MRWRREREPQPASTPEAEEELAEARAARETSEQAQREVVDRWPEVTEVSSSLRRHRERNGFRELFERALRGGHDPASG